MKTLHSDNIHIFPISTNRTGNDDSDLGDRALSERNLTNIVKGYYDKYQEPQTLEYTFTIENGDISFDTTLHAYEDGYVIDADIKCGGEDISATVDFVINGYRSCATIDLTSFNMADGDCIYAVLEMAKSDTVYPIINGEDDYDEFDESIKKFTGVRFVKDQKNISASSLPTWLIRTEEPNSMYFVRILEMTSSEVVVPRRSKAKIRHIDGGIV